MGTMLSIAVGVAVTGSLIVKIWFMAGRHAADMGSVSNSWLMAHNASERPAE
jgi:hypothetical protein